jgi:hypothetical protein
VEEELDCEGFPDAEAVVGVLTPLAVVEPPVEETDVAEPEIVELELWLVMGRP